MSNIRAITRREVGSYFSTPLAYIFVVIFLVMNGIATFYFGGFFEREQADLIPFFTFQPWLYLFLIPALSMRLWAEERRSGSIELLMTLPVSAGEVVIAKFLGAWIIAGCALTLTFPIWITVNYLGDPDNGAIIAAYLGSWLLAGSFLAIGACISAANTNQIIAFILTIFVCFLFLLSGFPVVLDFFGNWAPQALLDAIAELSFLTHFQALSKGILDLRDIIYFSLVIGCFLYANTVVLDLQKAR